MTKCNFSIRLNSFSKQDSTPNMISYLLLSKGYTNCFTFNLNMYLGKTFFFTHVTYKPSILISPAAVTKHHRLCGINTIYFSSFWKLRILWSKVLDLLSGEHLLPCLQIAVRAIPTWQREQKESELFLVSPSKSTNLILEDSNLINLITSQRCHFLTSLHGGLWIQQMILRGIQTYRAEHLPWLSSDLMNHQTSYLLEIFEFLE